MAYSRMTIDCYKLYVKKEKKWKQEKIYYTESDMNKGFSEYKKSCSYPVKVVLGREPITENNKEYLGMLNM